MSVETEETNLWRLKANNDKSLVCLLNLAFWIGLTYDVLNYLSKWVNTIAIHLLTLPPSNLTRFIANFRICWHLTENASHLQMAQEEKSKQGESLLTFCIGENSFLASTIPLPISFLCFLFISLFFLLVTLLFSSILFLLKLCS